MRRFTGAACLLLVVILAPVSALAQGLNPQPPGPYVVDVRGSTLGLPQTSDFYPAIPPGTAIPARGFGLEAGAHLYPFAIGPSRLGVGVDLFWVRGSATSPAPSDTDPAVTPLPDVVATLRTVTPQVSVNFGTSRGWSYLTLGAGGASMMTDANGASASRSSLDVNTGGGARWFVRDHLAVGFDLRLHWIGGNTLFGASVGLSFH